VTWPEREADLARARWTTEHGESWRERHACPVADQGHELKADRTVESCDPLPTNYGHVA
jgi:hypothetical protein